MVFDGVAVVRGSLIRIHRCAGRWSKAGWALHVATCRKARYEDAAADNRTAIARAKAIGNECARRV